MLSMVLISQSFQHLICQHFNISSFPPVWKIAPGEGTLTITINSYLVVGHARDPSSRSASTWNVAIVVIIVATRRIPSWARIPIVGIVIWTRCWCYFLPISTSTFCYCRSNTGWPIAHTLTCIVGWLWPWRRNERRSTGTGNRSPK